MATITEARDAIAEKLGAALDIPHRSGRQPSPLFPLTVFLTPTGGSDYATFEDAAWENPIIALSAVVCGPVANLDVSYRWLDDAVVTVAQECLAGDGTVGGLISGLLLRYVRQPGWLTVEGTSPVLSAEMVLAPFYLRP